MKPVEGSKVMIQRNEDGTVTITGSDINTYRVLNIRRGLILAIDTGMSLTRVSSLSVARRDGLTGKRTNRGALVDVNAWLAERGLPRVWSKKFPQG